MNTESPAETSIEEIEKLMTSTNPSAAALITTLQKLRPETELHYIILAQAEPIPKLVAFRMTLAAGHIILKSLAAMLKVNRKHLRSIK